MEIKVTDPFLFSLAVFRTELPNQPNAWKRLMAVSLSGLRHWFYGLEVSGFQPLPYHSDGIVLGCPELLVALYMLQLIFDLS